MKNLSLGVINNKIEKRNKKIYLNIIFEMKKNKTTQIQLADKLGMKDSSINRSLKNLEKGKSILTETLFKIAYALEIEVTELLK